MVGLVLCATIGFTDEKAFRPQDVFAALYKKVCASHVDNMALQNGERVTNTFIRTGIVRLIESQFVGRAGLIQTRSAGRLRVLDEFRAWLSPIKTYRSCLACLQRIPEYKFPCCHMLCEECCIDLGQRTDSDPHLFTFSDCAICKLSCDVRIRMKPATAGIRVLSIDGGGVRAVVPIQFLRALEQALGLDMPVQEHFDLSYGTSSGWRLL